VVFVDSLNWCYQSIKKIGAKIGLPKLEMPGELGDDKDWLEYCWRDTEILEQLILRILRLHKSNDLGNLRWTAAGQSVASWRHGRMDCEIVVGHAAHIKSAERKSYYGARHRAFFQGLVCPEKTDGLGALSGAGEGDATAYAGPLYRLDLTSAYPTIMGRRDFPTRYRYRELRPSKATIESVLDNQECCALVSIQSETIEYPIQIKKQTWHAVGALTTYLAGPELREAWRMGHVREIHELFVYDRGRPFATWSEWIVGLRQLMKSEGNELESDIVKSIANSLYGKFAQRGIGWETVPGAVAPTQWGAYSSHDLQRHIYTHYRAINWIPQRYSDVAEPDGSFPIISAYVTSYFRLLMSSIIDACPYRSVYYEDADSIHCTGAALSTLRNLGWVSDSAPGMLRVVDSAQVVRYLGPKKYTWNGKLVCPGVSSRAVIDPRGLWHQTEFARLDAQLARGKPVGPESSERTIDVGVDDVGRGVSSGGWLPRAVGRGWCHDGIATDYGATSDAGGLDRPV
jgi:hypothetical protein